MKSDPAAELRYRRTPLHTLWFFEAVARHGNFTNAALELQVTQSAVSKQVKKLEQSLGADLFSRASLRPRLTWQGQRLYEVVSPMLRNISDAVAALNEVESDR